MTRKLTLTALSCDLPVATGGMKNKGNSATQILPEECCDLPEGVMDSISANPTILMGNHQLFKVNWDGL